MNGTPDHTYQGLSEALGIMTLNYENADAVRVEQKEDLTVLRTTVDELHEVIANNGMELDNTKARLRTALADREAVNLSVAQAVVKMGNDGDYCDDGMISFLGSALNISRGEAEDLLNEAKPSQQMTVTLEFSIGGHSYNEITDEEAEEFLKDVLGLNDGAKLEVDSVYITEC